jgi:hypothetical protein
MYSPVTDLYNSQLNQLRAEYAAATDAVAKQRAYANIARFVYDHRAYGTPSVLGKGVMLAIPLTYYVIVMIFSVLAVSYKNQLTIYDWVSFTASLAAVYIILKFGYAFGLGWLVPYDLNELDPITNIPRFSDAQHKHLQTATTNALITSLSYAILTMILYYKSASGSAALLDTGDNFNEMGIRWLSLNYAFLLSSSNVLGHYVHAFVDIANPNINPVLVAARFIPGLTMGKTGGGTKGNTAGHTAGHTLGATRGSINV